MAYDNILKTNSLNLEEFESVGIDYFFDNEISQDNLFALSMIYDPYDDPNNEGYKDPKTTIATTLSDKTTEFGNTGFLLNSISFPFWSLDFEYNVIARQNFLKEIKKDLSITLSWQDDIFKTIRNYHIHWINGWYNYQKDHVISGNKNKYRNLVFHTFRYDEDGLPEIINTYRISGLVPSIEINFNYDYKKKSSDLLSYTYKFSKLEIFNKEEKSIITG